MRVVCFGDSITAGQHVAPDQAWPSLIAGHDVVAKGVSGDTTRGMLERFPRDVQESGADVVLMQAGHNDCNRWLTDRGCPRVSLPAYVANVAEMIDRCAAFGIAAVWFTAVPAFRPGRYCADLAVYNEHGAKAAEDSGAVVVDTRSAFAASLPALLLADGLHLNTRGHLLYAHVAQGFLDRAFQAAA